MSLKLWDMGHGTCPPVPHPPVPQKYNVKNENPEKNKQEIEAQIINLEDRIKVMEGLFDKSTPIEKYQEYSELLKEVDRLYGKWNNLLT